MNRPPVVHIIGTGLIGASIGLGLTRHGYTVTLEDSSPTHAALARDLGAGVLLSAASQEPDLVIVATPPDVVAATIERALQAWPKAGVTDVASVKGSVAAELAARAVDTRRYCGSHPMAGRERSGAISGRHDLFHGRAWVLTPTASTDPAVVESVRIVAQALGALVVQLSPADHDSAVAAVSHAPQIASSVVAARLEALAEDAISLAGQGLRDVTRIAASDPQLWTQILAGNAAAVRDVLAAMVEDLTGVIHALDQLEADGDAPGARATLANAIAAGNAGHSRLPGKHGAAPTAYDTVRVLVPDEPGQLARLFSDIGLIGANIEEFHLDHGLGQSFGLAELDVLPGVSASLSAGLLERGWRLHG